MTKDVIKRITKKFWEEFEPSKIDDAMHFYVLEKQKRLDGKSLLEAELEYARSEGRLTSHPCETLVLLVGFSLEPLLQSVCVYRPHKIVLILNEQGYPPEEWHVFANHIKDAIGLLEQRNLLPHSPKLPGKDGKVGYPAADDPSAVFQTLIEVLHDETDVVIDVSGGKKSMVSGAYLYAAYAEARISYVDFDEYDPQNRRPYGYSCRIGELSNPYQTFVLREWERMRALYEQYQFREARAILHSMSSVMTQVVPQSGPPIQMLQAFLEFYEKWDSGDYRGAKQFASEQNLPSFERPSAVTDLGDKWFEISGNDFTKPKHFYGDLDGVKVYVADELARIRRLIDYSEDYRSAFLRAGGVNEIVMVARLVRLVTNRAQRNDLLDALDEHTPGIFSIFTNLTKPAGTAISIYKNSRSQVRFGSGQTLLATISLQHPLKDWWSTIPSFRTDGWKKFLEIRNKLAHTYFSVPREWAEDALRFVQANFEDFLGHPVGDLDLRTKALSWPELCEKCGLSRFLPPNLRKEAK